MEIGKNQTSAFFRGIQRKPDQVLAAPDVPATDEELIAAIAADPHNHQACSVLWDRCEPFLRRWLSSHHQYLPKDLFSDILQEAWIYAYTNLEKFDAARGTIKKWLLGLVRNAVKMVRRDMGIPDPERSEVPGSIGDSGPVIRSYDLSFEEVSETDPAWVEQYNPVDGPESEVIHDMQVKWLITQATMTAPPTVAQALVLVAMDDSSLNQAAARQGIHRKTLTRHIRTWAEDNQLGRALVLGD